MSSSFHPPAPTPESPHARPAAPARSLDLAGDRALTAETILPVVYEELRYLARTKLGAGQGPTTVDSSALVHEAFVRLAGGADIPSAARGVYFAAAARAMRRILVERARHRSWSERVDGGPGGEVRTSRSGEHGAREMLAIDDALRRLQSSDPAKVRVVELRYFAGLTLDQTASAMERDARWVRQEWDFARAWLHRELARTAARPPDQVPGWDNCHQTGSAAGDGTGTPTTD